MGWWRSQHGMIGDGPADIMDAAIKKIENEYMSECKRLPTQGEMSNLIEFCTGGCLLPQCGDVAAPFTGAQTGDDIPRAREQGFQGAMGPASVKGIGVDGDKLANVDPDTEENIDIPGPGDTGQFPIEDDKEE